jgi:hypothetical protein
MADSIPLTTSNVPFGKPARRSHKVLWTFLILLLLIILAGGYILARAMWLPPKDLGVRYTDADYASALQKIGIQIDATLLAADTNAPAALSIQLYNRTLNPLVITGADLSANKLKVADYTWTFSNYEHRTFSLTSAESTAFINRVLPRFTWFENAQISVSNDKILFSSVALVGKMKEELFADFVKQIPVPLPDRVNLFAKGTFSIANNQVVLAPEVIQIGDFSLPAQYIAPDKLASVGSNLERIIHAYPKIDIIFAGVKNGQLYFDGVIPTKVVIKPK